MSVRCLVNGLEVNYPCSPVCPLFGDCVTAFNAARTQSVRTNADRIRAMSDEELVDALMTFLVKSVENSEFSKVKVEFEEGYRDALLEELRKPVKDGDNDG